MSSTKSYARLPSLQIENEGSSSKKYKSFLSDPNGLSDVLELKNHEQHFYTNTKTLSQEGLILGKWNGKLAEDEVDNPKSDKLLNGHVTTLEESKEKLFASMKYEINRLNTFWDKWPIDYVKPKDLAEAGLFYLLTEDKVQCAFCRGIISDWVAGDKPLIEHSKNFSLCPFLLARDVGNIPMVSASELQMQLINTVSNGFSCDSRMLSSVSYKPRHSSMAEYERRLRTFKGWPLTMLQPEEVARAGFYYTAISDVVTCFFCDGSLGNWDIGDDPWTEHSKYFPNCTFIELAKDADSKKTLQTNHLMTTNTSQRSAMNDSQMQNGQILKSRIVQKASEIFPEKLVTAVVIKKYNTSKEEFSSLQELCEELLEQKQENLKCKESQTSSSPVKEISVERTKKDVLLCKICMDKEMGVVFLPCGHLLACQSCAEEMSICPLCRKIITSTVRTYMS